MTERKGNAGECERITRIGDTTSQSGGGNAKRMRTEMASSRYYYCQHMLFLVPGEYRWSDKCLSAGCRGRRKMESGNSAYSVILFSEEKTNKF